MALGGACSVGIALALPWLAVAVMSAPSSDAEFACEDDFAEECAMKTALLQTSAEVRLPHRSLASEAAPSTAFSARSTALHNSVTTGAVKLLEADAAAMAQASRATSAGTLRFGPYGSERARAYVGEYDCGTYQHANVYFPVARGDSGEPGRVPLISFAHGHGGGGPDVGPNHGSLLPFLASWGFVVVAHESELRERPSESLAAQVTFDLNPESLEPDGRITLFCENSTADQIRNLEWARNSEFADRIDWDKQTGIAGFSMGGTATVVTALNAEAVSVHNIGAAFSLAPYFRTFTIDFDRPLQIPSMIAAADMDETCPAAESQEFFDSQEGLTSHSRIFASITGAAHRLVLIDEVYHVYAAALFRCHLNSDEDSCRLLYGDSEEECACDGVAPCSLCSCSRVSICERRSTPSLD